jgi:hypothetical protein
MSSGEPGSNFKGCVFRVNVELREALHHHPGERSTMRSIERATLLPPDCQVIGFNKAGTKSFR